MSSDDRFVFNYDCLTVLLEEKQKTLNFSTEDIINFSLEKDIKFSLRHSSFLLQNNKRYLDIIKKSGIQLTLKEIFSFDDNMINVLLELSELRCENNKKCKCTMVALYLKDVVIKEEQKYFKSHCFVVNMSYTPDFETGISLFNFDNSSINEGIMNIFKSNNGNKSVFISPIGFNNDHFSKDCIDLNMFLLKKIIKISKDVFEADILFNDIRDMYNVLDKIEIKYRYERVMNIINMIMIYENNEKIHEIKNNRNRFFDLMYFINIGMNILKLAEIDSQILMKFYNFFGIFILNMRSIINNIINYLQHISNQDMIDLIMEIIKNENIDSEYIKRLDEFGKGLFELSMIRSKLTTDQTKIETREFLSMLFEATKYVTIDTNFIHFVIIYPFNDLIEIIFMIYVIRGCCKSTGLYIVDVINFFSAIKNNSATLQKINEEFFYEGEHIGNYFLDNSDNYLYNRVARSLLLKKLFKEKIKEYELMGIKCSSSVFNRIPYHKLGNSRIIDFYGQKIDVHDKNRDVDTYRIYDALFSLNFNDKNDSQLTEDNPWEILDNKREKKDFQENLTIEMIEILFNEFWEYCKNYLNEDQKIKFFRVMGVDFNFIPIDKLHEDFNGLFTGAIYINSVTVDPKQIIAYLWKFTKGYPLERLQESMVMALINSIQEKSFIVGGQRVTKNYAVCNQGKIQNMAVAVLQGRIEDYDGNLILIDKSDNIKIKEEFDNLENITPVDIYHLIKPFYDYISLEGSIPENSDSLFRKLFIYIRENNLEKYAVNIIENVCLYVEDKNGFNINVNLSLASYFSECFQLDDYILAKEYINQRNTDQDIYFQYDEYEDEYEDDY